MHQPRRVRPVGAGTLAALLLATSTASATQLPLAPAAPDTPSTPPPATQPVAVPAPSTTGAADVPDLAGAPGMRASPTLARDRRSLLDVGAAGLDVPAGALASYRFAASTLDAADPACRLSWPLLAAIGRVESDHGRHGGADLGNDGVSEPAIRGAALDGSERAPRVPDTDQGRLDGDARWDRAVGPMQFLPSTWVYVGVDADGDGVRSADDLDDAALGAAVYLCAGDHDLSTRAGRSLAVHSYNPSERYVDAVLRLSREYAAGAFEELWPEAPGFTVLAMPMPMPMAARPISPPSTAPTRHPQTGQPQTEQPSPEQPTPGQPPPEQPQTEQPSPGQPSPEQPQKTPEPGAESAVPSAQDPGPSSPEPEEQPSTEPEEQPEPPQPAPTEKPEKPAEPEPTPPETPDVTTLVGPLRVVDGTWTLGETPLDVGDETLLATTAQHDLDGDGTLESNMDELTGLVEAGTEHTVEVLSSTGPALLWGVDGLAYRDE